ncbi:TRAP transporter small permease [Chelativorans xinjiangense]|uniref:TRAP transporter small permease n=1 Tax=Chelativorans xinjiangense TaxID=2681485 RepID=UPI00135A7BBB|nr:TRAP transporter small permease [Chelativorans xinjiangense]
MTLILKFADIAGWFASTAARILLIAVVLFLVAQVTLRFGFNYSLPWPEEASRYLMIWIVMLTASQLVRYNELVRVDFLDKLWPKKLLVWRNALFRVVMIAMFSLMAYHGWLQADFAWRRTTAALQISWFWPYLSIPVGCALVVFQLVAVTIREFLTGAEVTPHIVELQETAE